MGRGCLTPDTLPQLLPHVHRQVLLSLPLLLHTSSSKAAWRGAFFYAHLAGCWLATVKSSLLWLKFKIVSCSEKSTQYNFKCMGQSGLIAPKGIHGVFPMCRSDAMPKVTHSIPGTRPAFGQRKKPDAFRLIKQYECVF